MQNKNLLPILFFAASAFQSYAQQKIVGSAGGATQTVIASPRIKSTNVRFLKQPHVKQENNLTKDEMFSLVPNPVKSKAVLKNDAGLLIKQIIITDLTGKTISQNKVESSGSRYSINCSSLASENYLLTIEYIDANAKENTQTIKFTKQ